MSDTTNGFGSSDLGPTIRLLSVRMTDDIRAQLDIIAQLNNRSVTEEVRLAIESWITTSKAELPLGSRRATRMWTSISWKRKRPAVSAL